MVGDGINPIIEALRQHRDKIRFLACFVPCSLRC
ncbi:MULTISPECIES: hypothetical protein [unclassified Caballeronia]